MKHHRAPEAAWLNPECLMFRKVERGWEAEQLLDQKGWFPLPDVMKRLAPNRPALYRKILKMREKMLKAGLDTRREMGVKQYGSRLWAEMPTFSRWYCENEALAVSRIPTNWDLQMFLKQKTGIFALSRALKLLPREWPVKYHTVKNLILTRENPRDEMGADKLKDGGYVVFMPRFGEWLKSQVS